MLRMLLGRKKRKESEDAEGKRKKSRSNGSDRLMYLRENDAMKEMKMQWKTWRVKKWIWRKGSWTCKARGMMYLYSNKPRQHRTSKQWYWPYYPRWGRSKEIQVGLKLFLLNVRDLTLNGIKKILKFLMLKTKLCFVHFYEKNVIRRHLKTLS